jgi:polyisoprenyl-phosphate glycosyltransferase
LDLSIVVPVYNSDESLPLLVREIQGALDGKIKYEVLFVNDGSKNQKTREVLKTIVSVNSNIQSIELRRNYGQHAATVCGFAHASGSWIVTLDDDLQHDPAEILKLWPKREHDIVMGQYESHQFPLKRRIFSKVKSIFDHIILDIPEDIRLTSYRLIKKDVVASMLSIKSDRPFLPTLMAAVTSDIVGVTVGHRKRVYGHSTYGFFDLLSLFSNSLFNNSTLLLSVLGRIGLFFAVSSFVFGIYLIYVRLHNPNAPQGWTSLMVTIFFLGGVQMCGVSLLGEYLLRLVKLSENRPTFTVKSITRGKKIE